MRKQLAVSLLTLVNTATLLGVVYYFLPGFEHLLTQGTGSQPNAAFLCLLCFIFLFLTAVQLTPPRADEDEESGTCWACGKASHELHWWTIDERGPRNNQRVSYLIHQHCTWLAEKQASM